MLDECEIASGLKDWLVGKDKLDPLQATHLSEELGFQWRRPLGAPEEAIVAPLKKDTSGRPPGEPTAEAGSSEEEAILSAKKLRTVDREASYVIVASPGRISGYTEPAAMAVGWVGRETSEMLRSLIPSHQQAATPTFASYVGRLRRTTKRRGLEEPWYEATWEDRGSGFGPHTDGAGDPSVPQIDAAGTGL